MKRAKKEVTIYYDFDNLNNIYLFCNFKKKLHHKNFSSWNWWNSYLYEYVAWFCREYRINPKRYSVKVLRAYGKPDIANRRTKYITGEVFWSYEVNSVE